MFLCDVQGQQDASGKDTQLRLQLGSPFPHLTCIHPASTNMCSSKLGIGHLHLSSLDQSNFKLSQLEFIFMNLNNNDTFVAPFPNYSYSVKMDSVKDSVMKDDHFKAFEDGEHLLTLLGPWP